MIDAVVGVGYFVVVDVGEGGRGNGNERVWIFGKDGKDLVGVGDVGVVDASGRFMIKNSPVGSATSIPLGIPSSSTEELLSVMGETAAAGDTGRRMKAGVMGELGRELWMGLAMAARVFMMYWGERLK